jgi:hypothetical protein
MDIDLPEIDLGEFPEHGELPKIPDSITEIPEAAAIDFMIEVRQTGNVETFARVALRFGCTMQQAYAVARWFDICSWRSASSRRTRSAITSQSMMN